MSKQKNHPADQDILARTLYGEALHGRTDLCRAIASVVLNRMAHSKERGHHWWGNTIGEICTRSWQFACWNPGSDKRAVVECVTDKAPRFRSCLKIARQALAGELEDNTGGATHYHHMKVLPPWARNRRPSATISDYRFYNLENVT